MNTKRMGKRLFAILLCLTMVLSVVPVLGTDAACDHGDHFIWTSVSGDEAIPTTGSVVLESDVVLDTTVAVTGDLHLCLNGHSITGTADPYFFVGEGTRLTLCDCTGEGTVGALPSGSQYTAALKNGYIKAKGGKFIMNGGTLTGNESSSYWGGAVQLIDATFVMKGGTITGNAAKHYGGAVSLEGASVFTMRDGTISNNTAGNGGAIAACNGFGQITINGGAITGNYAGERGGAIYCVDGEVKINDGYFADNVSVEDGGAFYVTKTDAENQKLNVLALGDKTTRDTLYYLGALGNAAGTPITVGYLQRDDEAVLRDYDYYMETGGAYTYYKTDADGKLARKGSYKITKALEDEAWDVIVLQNGILHAGVETTFNSDLEYMVDYMEDKAPFAKLYWNMTWALEEDISFTSLGIQYNDKTGHYGGYDGSQAIMYNSVVKCLDRFITGKDAPYNSTNLNNYGTGIGWGFDGYLYTGTAIQKLRQQTGEEPTRDGVYLSGVTGRVTAAVAALKALIPSADLNKLAENAQVLTAVNAMKKDTVSGISGDADLTAATLSSIVNAVKAAGADAADGQLEQLALTEDDVKPESPYADVTLAREDGPLRLRFPRVQKVGDTILVSACRGATHNFDLHAGESEVVFWIGKEDYTSEQWQESYENPVLLIDTYQMQQWGAIPCGGTIYDRYQAAKEGRIGYMRSGAGDADMTLAQIDMTGDGVKDEVLLLNFTSKYFENEGNGQLANPYQDARCAYLTYSLDGGKSWATPQAIYMDEKEVVHGLMKHGDIAVFNDGNILMPFYLGSGDITALALELRFDTATKKWRQVGETRVLPRSEEALAENAGSDGWNEPTVVSPDGSDTVYAMVRNVGIVLKSEDRGVNWTRIANEPGLAAQPRFTILADDLVYASWRKTTGSTHGTASTLFYTDADWTDTPSVGVYVTPDVGGDLGDQSTTLLSDGRIFAVNYDVKYNAIVACIEDPLGADFDKYKPIEVGMDSGEETITLYSAGSAPYTTSQPVTGSHTVSADVKFQSGGRVTIHTTAGDVTVPYTDELAMNQSAKVAVSVVGKYMYTRVTQGNYDSGWTTAHGAGTGTKTGIEGTNVIVSNVKVTRQVIIDMNDTMVAAVGDDPRQMECSLLPVMEGYTFESTDESVVKVTPTGLVTFVGEGSAEVVVKIGSASKACQVVVYPLSAELTGAGKRTVIVDDDFESAATYAGDNTYSAGDSIVDVDANNWYSFKKNADKSLTVVETDGENQYLKISTINAWFANTKDIVGDYTVQFDLKFDNSNVLYVTLWQTSNTASTSNKVDAMFYLMSWGIKFFYDNEQGDSIAVPEGTTSSFIPYGNGCASELGKTDTWVRVKMVRAEGFVYLKTWNRDMVEPDGWTFRCADPALKADGVGHLRITGNGVGEYRLDNLLITKQSV